MSFKTKIEQQDTTLSNGITYTVGDPRYPQYVSVPMEAQHTTSLEQLAGFAIKNEATGMNNKVYMVLHDENQGGTSVVGPDMPSIEQFNEDDQGKDYDNDPGGETVYYVVGSDNTITDPKTGKEIVMSQPMHLLEGGHDDDDDDDDDLKKKKKKTKAVCMKDDGPSYKYPLPSLEIPDSRKGIKNKMNCKHCKIACQEDISHLISHYCGYCPFGTYEIDALNTHIREEHPLDKKNWFIKCKQCNYTTVCKSNLKYHVRYCHDTSNTYYCEFCDFSTVIKKEFHIHVVDRHIGERLYKCPFCLYRSCHQNEIDRHMTALHPDQITYLN